MKPIIFLLLLSGAPSVYANQSIALSPITFQVRADDAFSKLEKTILYPEALLKRFHPVGAKISNKRVSQNVVSFVATKGALFISKSVYVNAVLESNIDSRTCPKEEVGFSLKMQFDSSDTLVTNNVEELQAIICIQSQSDTLLKGTVRSKVITGNNYSSMLGPIAINLIKAQISPLLNALTEEIRSLR